MELLVFSSREIQTTVVYALQNRFCIAKAEQAFRAMRETKAKNRVREIISRLLINIVCTDKRKFENKNMRLL